MLLCWFSDDDVDEDTLRSVCRLQKTLWRQQSATEAAGSVQCAPHSLGVNSPLLTGSSASRPGFISKPP